MANPIDPRRLLAHLETWSSHKDLLVHSVAEGLRQRILNGEFDYQPDPIAVSNHVQSEYYKKHPIQDDAGDEYRDNPEEWE